MDVINFIIENSTNIIQNGGIIFGFLLVFLECFIPALPLSVFVALNANAFGIFLGIVISWIATCLGSFCCYIIFCYLEEKFINKFMSKRKMKKLQKGIDRFRTIKFPQLVLIITLPFTPSFLVNILGGLARVKKEKFIAAILIGKVFTVVFWGYIGKSLIESLTDIYSIIYIILALVIAYVISKIISKRMNIE